MNEELVVRFGRSKSRNFGIIDTIGVPHPYMVGPRHVAHAADNFGGMLSKACVEDGERKKILKCEWKGCTLKWAQHETALLVECLKDPNSTPELKEELETYIKSAAASFSPADTEKYAGFAFMKKGWE